MSFPELKEHIKGFLKEHKQASLATCMNNIPRSSPVQYFMGDDLDIYVLSAGGDKFNAIKENPNVCLLVSTEYINYRQIKGVQIFGNAETSEGNSEIYKEAKMYYTDPYVLENEEENLKIIRIKPMEIVYLDSIEKGNRTKQILRNDEVILKEDSMIARH